MIILTRENCKVRIVYVELIRQIKRGRRNNNRYDGEIMIFPNPSVEYDSCARITGRIMFMELRTMRNVKTEDSKSRIFCLEKIEEFLDSMGDRGATAKLLEDNSVIHCIK